MLGLNFRRRQLVLEDGDQPRLVVLRRGQRIGGLLRQLRDSKGRRHQWKVVTNVESRFDGKNVVLVRHLRCQDEFGGSASSSNLLPCVSNIVII